MNKTAVITDSNSGITQQEAKEMGVFVLPMPFFIDEKEYYEDITLTQEEFYDKLIQDASVNTSQPSPDSVLALWKDVLKEYEEIIFVPMSSGLSGTCQTAIALAEEFGGRVQVVDNQRISVTQKRSVEDALCMASQGKSAVEIKDYLMKTKKESSIYITVATLKYLKKGGRITPAAATLGSLLKLKPVLQIQGEKLDAYAKARTMSQAKNIMLHAMEKDMEERFRAPGGRGMYIDIAHSQDEKAAYELKEELVSMFPECAGTCVAPLSLSVACHIGEGALAVACSRKYE